jgi:esterase/lipase superfamily enzyme/uncharacterized protein (DUF2147 family)
MRRIGAFSFLCVFLALNIFTAAAAERKPVAKPQGMYVAVGDGKSATGIWQKEVDGKPAAWFFIFEDNGAYEAKLVKAFPGFGQPTICSSCPDDRKNVPVVGLTVIRELKRNGFDYTNGNLLDVRDGRTYPTRLKLSEDGKKLNLRVQNLGLLGGEGDTWTRLPASAIEDVDKGVLATFLPGAAPSSDDVRALQPVFFATNRRIKDGPSLTLASITSDRSMDLKYGLTIVGVPKNHSIGHVERPQIDLIQSIIHLGLVYEKETDKDHFRIRSIAPLGRSGLIEALQSNSESVLLFIHGYNVPFDDAVFKAAQIAYDANFSGSVLVFSWPSAGAILGYDHDRESALFSGEDLLKVFRMLSDEIGNKRVFVLAHSLGNEILVTALQQAALSKSSLQISELMMAAPDVDKDVFLKKAADIKSVAKNMTLYASSADKCLLASQKKAWGTRMGFVNTTGPTLVEGVETIDVTAVGADMLGLDHSTFSSERAVLEDIGHLIMSTKDGEHLPPDKRLTTLKFMPDRDHVKYWLFPK